MPQPTPCQNLAEDPDVPAEDRGRTTELVADDWFIDPPMAGTGTGKGTVAYTRRRRALEACWADCPMRTRLECLHEGMKEPNLQWGIWGGYTEEQRRQIADEIEQRKARAL